MRPGYADGGARDLTFVAAKIVQDDDLARRQGWDEDVTDVALEDDDVDGTVNHLRGGDAVVAEHGDRGERAPAPVRDLRLQTSSRAGPIRATAPCWA